MARPRSMMPWTFDIKVDIRDTRATCCVTEDVDFDVRFRCTSSGDLEADPITQFDRLTGANLCGDALVSLASTTHRRWGPPSMPG